METIDETILNHQRIAARELGTMRREREGYPYDVDLPPRLAQVRDATREVRAQLGQLAGERATEVETWLATTEQQVAELDLLTEAIALFHAEAEVEGIGAIRFIDALDATERGLARNPERAEQAWDGATQLVGPLERLGALPEVAAALSRYRALAGRVAVELAPLLASIRARPFVGATREAIESLERMVDQADERAVMARRADLRRALAAMPRDVPEALELDARATALFARSEEELGDSIVLQELEEIERTLAPLVDEVERALALKSTERAIAHAPRLLAGLPRLAPYANHARAQRLEQRGRAALGRIEAELGCMRQVEAADAVPVIAFAPGSGTRIEAVVRNLNKVLTEYRAAHLATQAKFEADVDLVSGVSEPVTRRIASDIETTAGEMVRAVRRAETLAGELKLLDAQHPGLAQVAEATPVLIRRAKDWKARLATLSQFANAVGDTRWSIDRAREGSGTPDSGYQALMMWPEVLSSLANADRALATAAEILPGERERVAPLRLEIAALRRHATAQLTSVCVAEATRMAAENNQHGAQRFADVLAEALPDAPENARIAAILAGTADARVRAALEIEQHGELIRREAEIAARAARPTFDDWVAQRPPLVTLAGSIVANLDAHRGRFIAGRCSHLGISLADEPATIRGDVYQVDYDPEVRRRLAEGMARLDGMFASRAEQTAAAAGVSGLCTTAQHYPKDAYYHAEIVGIASHTPEHEVRDAHGTVITRIAGTPYPVPRIVIRAVATTYYVIVPG